MNKLVKRIVESKFNFNIDVEDIEDSKNEDSLSRSVHVPMTQRQAYERQQMVNLDLPSGIRWCRYNAGVDHDVIEKIIKNPNGPFINKAYNPWIGEICAWGETYPHIHAIMDPIANSNVEDKYEYNWYNYKFTKEDDYEVDQEKLPYRLTKYCTKRSYGKNFFKDNLKTLELVDDEAAFDALKQDYKCNIKMPSSKDYLELLEYTTSKLVDTYEGVHVRGLLLTSKSNNEQLFFPYTGMMCGPFHQGDFNEGHYWCSDLFEDEPCLAYAFNFGTFRHIEDKVAHSLNHRFPLPQKYDEYTDDTGTIITYERYRGLAIRGISA